MKAPLIWNFGARRENDTPMQSALKMRISRLLQVSAEIRQYGCLPNLVLFIVSKDEIPALTVAGDRTKNDFKAANLENECRTAQNCGSLDCHRF